MTKQEEIREILDTLCCVANAKDLTKSPTGFDEEVETAMQELDSQGVVIKVECPDCEWSQVGDESVGMTPCHSCNSTGYIVEPLIEEKE